MLPTIYVAYLRVSTDDKGQDVASQRARILAWEERERVLVARHFVDEGTSASKTNPFERPVFLEALRAAADGGAGLVVAEPGRLTRQGSHEMGWAMVEAKNLAVRIVFADAALAGQDEIGGRVVQAVQAEAAAAWVKTHSAATRAAMQKKSGEGQHMGRPRKAFTDAEDVLMVKLKSGGMGYRRIAVEVNQLRGVHRIADPKARRRRAVSHASVQRRLAALGMASQNPKRYKSLGGSERVAKERKGPLVDGPIGAPATLRLSEPSVNESVIRQDGAGSAVVENGGGLDA